MATRRCSQCGAEVALADDRLSTTCAFCDSPLVDGSAVSEPIESVVPFAVTRQRASDLLRAYLSRQWLAPEALRKAARADAVDAVFVPFYAYDAVARSTWSARVGIHWYRTETYTTTENGKRVTRTRTVQETEWFPLSGQHARQWHDHLVSASAGLPEAEANALEPYDLGAAMPWAEAAVAGVAAEIPTVDHAAAHATAHQELTRKEAQAIAEKLLPGDTHDDLRVESAIHVETVRLALLPVWVAAVRGPAGPVRLLVNGQTGEVVGVVPRSWAKLGCAAVGAVLLLAVALGGVGLCSGLLAMVSP